MANNPKIGTVNANGSLSYPAQTISGRDYVHTETSAAPTIVHMIAGGKHFVVGEQYPPRDFDYAGELKKLAAQVATPTISGKREANEKAE